MCWEKTACCRSVRYVLCAGERLPVGNRLPVIVPVGALHLVCWENTACWEKTARCVEKRLPAAGVCATSCVLGIDCLLGKDCLKECLLERYLLCAGKRLSVGKLLPVVLGRDCLLQECALCLVCWGKTACWSVCWSATSCAQEKDCLLGNDCLLCWEKTACCRSVRYVLCAGERLPACLQQECSVRLD